LPSRVSSWTSPPCARAIWGVGHGVRHQVGEKLRGAVGIEGPRHVALDPQSDGPHGIGGGDLLDHAASHLSHVGLLAMDGNAAAEARLGEVEQIGDHPRHPLPAGADAGSGGKQAVRSFALAEDHPGACHDCAERGAEIVAEDADEPLAEVRRLLLLDFVVDALGFIAEGDDGAAERAVRLAQWHRRRGERAQRPVGRAMLHDCARRLALQRPRQRHLLGRDLPALRIAHPRSRPGFHRGPGPHAHLLRGAVDEAQGAVRVGHDDPFADLLDDGGEQLALLLELFALHHLRGHVPEDDGHVRDLLVGVQQREEGGADRRPVAPLHFHLLELARIVPDGRQVDGLALERAADEFEDPLLRGDLVAQDVVLGRRFAAEEVEERLVHQNGPAARLVDLEPDGSEGEEPFQDREGIGDSREYRADMIQIRHVVFRGSGYPARTNSA
jgi:hypothetical protein